jgi:hypothetical protein
VRKFLRVGENTFAVAVKNNAASGGLNKGVELEFHDSPVLASWKRSLFNGWAQVIVQAGKNPGEILLKASADGLQPATLTLRAQAALPRLPQP